MLKKVTLALAALFFLAACSSSHKSSLNTGTGHHHASTGSNFEREVGDRVFFAYDSSDLSAESKAQLDKQIAWMKKHPSMKVTIAGHCDERGTREYNLALGERRADKVKNYLVHHGVESHKVETISYGKEKPAVIGNDEEAWGKNRRAVTEPK